MDGHTHIRKLGHLLFEMAYHNAARHSLPIGSFSDFPGMPCRTASRTLPRRRFYLAVAR